MQKFVNQSFEEMRDVTFTAVSPDEAYILYGVGGVDLQEDKSLGWLHLYDVKAGRSRQLTYSGKEFSAEWIDANTILFSGDRSGQASKSKEPLTIFYALDINGGEAYERFRVPVVGASAQHIGEGNYVIYGTRDNSPEADGNQELFEVYDEYPYHADGRGYVNKKRASLWLFNEYSGELKPLTEPLFQVNQVMNKRVKPVLSPDKKRLYYWGEVITGTTRPAQDVYVCDLETGESRLLFENNRYMLDGCVEYEGRVYFWGLVDCLNAGKDFFGSDIISIGPGETEYRVEVELDENLGKVVCYDGKFMLTCNEHDSSTLYTWVPGEKHQLLCKLEYLVEGSVNIVGGIPYYVGRAPMSMVELVKVEDGKCCAVTNVGGEFLSKYTFNPAEPVNVKCPEGHTVYGWVIKPHGYQPGVKYPGLLMIHGGPQSAYTNHLNFSMQRYAAEGYFVFFCNPRGSTRYGRAHMDLEGKFGTIDFDDFMAFTDAVIENTPDLDPDRLGVTGGSYGGYMTNWIIGHTDRFKGAIAQRSISNWISMYGCTDISYFVTWGQCGTPWSNFEKLWFHSPLKYADNFKTPTLFLQNDKDFRCPVEQAEQMLTALIERGVPARMVLFHNASHSVMTPKQRRRNDDEVIAWLDRYVKGEG